MLFCNLLQDAYYNTYNLLLPKLYTTAIVSLAVAPVVGSALIFAPAFAKPYTLVWPNKGAMMSLSATALLHKACKPANAQTTNHALQQFQLLIAS